MKKKNEKVNEEMIGAIDDVDDLFKKLGDRFVSIFGEIISSAWSNKKKTLQRLLKDEVKK